MEALFPDPATRYGVLIQFKLWLTLQEQIGALEHWGRKDLLRPDLLLRLQSVPGIGPILGMTILLESGVIERFASVGDYASLPHGRERATVQRQAEGPWQPQVRQSLSVLGVHGSGQPRGALSPIDPPLV